MPGAGPDPAQGEPVSMEMHQIRYFLAVCETLNFTRAAERCNVAQPSLTRAVKSLEEELGGPLFRRERQNTHLTALGEMMRPHLAQVLTETEAAKQRAKSFSRLEEATLKLGVMCSIGPARLAQFLRQFQARHPRIDVQLHEANATTIQKELVDGSIDVAIYGLPGALDERLASKLLYRERFVVVFAPGHPFEKLDSIRGVDLAGHKLVRRNHCEIREFVGSQWRERGVHVEIACSSDRDDWVQSMILAGLGFGDMPELSVTMPGLLTRPLIEPEILREVRVVTVRGRPHLPVIGALMSEATGFRWMPKEA
jgi:LysR family hydrogen peroxide-inducible transcriptional activator